MLTPFQAIALAALTLVASYVGVARFASWAERVKMLDIANQRSLHQQPKPRGAGLVIVALTIIGAWAVFVALGPHDQWMRLLAFTAGGLLIAHVSWCDDRFGVPAGVRLAVHGLSAVIAILGLGYWRVIALPLVGELSLGMFGTVITFLWIVGLTNAVNFMDGIDGLTGAQAVIAATGWLIIGWLVHVPLLATLSILLAATSLGFLLHNWPPARVFMGDIGSAFLGYSLAVVPLVIASSPSWSAMTAVLLVWPFVFDSGVTFLMRLGRGENVFIAHRTHFYQRLVAAGREHRSVTSFYAALAVAGALLALGWARQVPAVDLAVSLGLPVMSALVWCVVRRQEQLLRVSFRVGDDGARAIREMP